MAQHFGVSFAVQLLYPETILYEELSDEKNIYKITLLKKVFFQIFGRRF
jgi:hypothetical protein